MSYACHILLNNNFELYRTLTDTLSQIWITTKPNSLARFLFFNMDNPETC